MLDVVAGEDGDRPLGRQAAAQQRRGDGAHLREHLRVAQRAPCARAVALGEIDAVRRGLRPVHQPLGELRG